MIPRLLAGLLAFTLAVGIACGGSQDLPSKALRADRTITGPSSFPLAVDPGKVGKYPAAVKSGGGRFYDQVLEYRVWLHPEKGAEPLAGDQDYFFAFARYENALDFARKAKGAEEPLVLVRQNEWINEPAPGKYEVRRGERIAEWQAAWLKDSKRGPGSIANFLARSRKPRG